MMRFLLVIAAIVAFYVYLYRHWDYKKKFTFKTIMIYISLGMLLLNIWITIETVKEAAEEKRYNMLESRLERVVDYERRADFMGMQDILLSYNNFESEFEYAWERVLMNANYNHYIIFAKAYEAQLGEEYEKMADKYKEALVSLCENPVYSKNIPYAEDFLKRAAGIGFDF